MVKLFLQELMVCYVIKPPNSNIDLLSPSCIDKFQVMVSHLRSLLYIFIAHFISIYIIICICSLLDTASWLQGQLACIENTLLQ